MRWCLLGMMLTAGCGEPEVIVPRVLSVVSILPNQGATQISVTAEALVYFSDPVNDPEASARDIDIVCLGTPPCSDPDSSGCSPLTSSVTFASDAQVARIVPSPALGASLCYAVEVSKGIQSATTDVGPLPVTIQSVFETR